MIFHIKIPVNGDTYAYADSITSFAGPLIHYGYFVIGAFFYAVLQNFGMNALQTVTFMSIFFGSVCVASMYLFSIGLTKDRFQSLLAALILMFSGTFWFFAEHGEVYVPQLGLDNACGIIDHKETSFHFKYFVSFCHMGYPHINFGLPANSLFGLSKRIQQKTVCVVYLARRAMVCRVYFCGISKELWR